MYRNLIQEHIIVMLPLFPAMTRTIINLLPITRCHPLIWFPLWSFIMPKKISDVETSLSGWTYSPCLFVCFFNFSFKNPEQCCTSKLSVSPSHPQESKSHYESSWVLKGRDDVTANYDNLMQKKHNWMSTKLVKVIMLLLLTLTRSICREKKDVCVTQNSEAHGCLYTLTTTCADTLWGFQTHIRKHNLLTKCHNIIIMQYWSRQGWSIWIPIRMRSKAAAPLLSWLLPAVTPHR